MALLNFGFFGAEAFLPLTLTTVRGQPVMLSGLALSVASVCWTAGAWVPVKLGHRLRRRTSVMIGLSIVGIGLLGLMAILSPRVPAEVAVPLWAVVGVGVGLAFTTTSSAILEAAPPGQEGAASTSLQLAQFLGAGVASGLGGSIVVAPFAGDPPRVGIAVVDALMLAAILLALVAARGVSEPCG
jgi:MFS family permease